MSDELPPPPPFLKLMTVEEYLRRERPDEYGRSFVENWRVSLLADGSNLREEVHALCDLALRGLSHPTVSVSPDFEVTVIADGGDEKR